MIRTSCPPTPSRQDLAPSPGEMSGFRALDVEDPIGSRRNGQPGETRSGEKQSRLGDISGSAPEYDGYPLWRFALGLGAGCHTSDRNSEPGNLS
jgi:hypothetical protein